MIEVIALLGVAALFAFGVRKRLALVGTVTLAVLFATIAFVIVLPMDASGDVLDLPWRMSELGRLAAVVLLGTLSLLVVAVWVDEPAYNFFPTALVVAGVVLAVLVLTTPIAIYAALLFGLLVPVGSFTFQVHRNRSAEAAYRHFSFVALGGCLGIGALALSASLGRDQPPAFGLGGREEAAQVLRDWRGQATSAAQRGETTPAPVNGDGKPNSIIEERMRREQLSRNS